MALRDKGSFRDPSGFIFYADDKVFRAVRREDYDTFCSFLNSKFYRDSIKENQLIPCAISEFPEGADISSGDFFCVEPIQVPFISYPYEWCFSQYRDAALLTLNLQEAALLDGYCLKDASFFNVQFFGTAPVLIDSLSFERYVEGHPWVAYRQFCQHFLAPLALMKKYGSLDTSFLRSYIEGVPLELASELLSRKGYLSALISLHIHLHARLQRKHRMNGVQNGGKQVIVSKRKLLSIVRHLREGISALDRRPHESAWRGYYEDCSYSEEGIRKKEAVIDGWVSKIKPKVVWDLGCNTGHFSSVAANTADYVVASDADQGCVDILFRELKRKGEKKILPLVVDLTNPTSSAGWAHEERKSFLERGPADMVLALALIHHLVISNNTPLKNIAEFFSRCGNYLIIEFIPKADIQVQRLLASRRDVFDAYSREHFLGSFSLCFDLLEEQKIPDSHRMLFLMMRRQ